MHEMHSNLQLITVTYIITSSTFLTDPRSVRGSLFHLESCTCAPVRPEGDTYMEEAGCLCSAFVLPVRVGPCTVLYSCGGQCIDPHTLAVACTGEGNHGRMYADTCPCRVTEFPVQSHHTPHTHMQGPRYLWHD